MNRAELVEVVAKEMRSSKAAAERAVSAVLNGIAKGLSKDKKVQLVGFGTFESRKRKPRMGRNPRTGETIQIPAKKAVGFRAGKELKSKA
jgi:DNA-binding protein HU-beta